MPLYVHLSISITTKKLIRPFRYALRENIPQKSATFV